MSAPSPYPTPNNASFPALHLYPLDDSFIPKRIALTGGQRVKIARPPNTKTQPGERNGYFDSRVLSRQHAEVWEEGNKIFIKDVKSSNGTFINGERLSLEGRESDPYELKSDDILEFGVDIVSEDNKTVLHRKVVARVTCIFPKFGQVGQQAHDQFATISHGSSFNGAPPPQQQQRRSPQVPMIHQGLAGLGGMGGGIRAPGRGLTLDHVFSRLQAELAKSRDTGHDLQVLAGALGNIEETLNGSLPPTSAPVFPDVLPAVQPPRQVSVPTLMPPVGGLVEPVAAAPPPSDALAELQAQLLEHQVSLAAHVDGVRALESVLAEQEAMKRQVHELRQLVAADRQAQDGAAPEEGDDVGEDSDDESDTRSIATVTPHELDSAEENERAEYEGVQNGVDERGHENGYETKEGRTADDIDTLQEELEENRTRQRAQTPEPGMSSDRYADPSPSPSPPHAADAALSAPSALSTVELTERLTLLAAQLESALTVSSALQEQHLAAQATIATLEAKLARLEARQDATPPPAPLLTAEFVQGLQDEITAMRGELATERSARAEALAQRAVVVNGDFSGDHERRTGGVETGTRSPSPGSGARRRRGRRRSSSAGGETSGVERAGLQNGTITDGGFAATEHISHSSLPSVLPKEAQRSLSTESDRLNQLRVQTAFGVLLLGIAAAAVLWRVKPE
ncbi:hypothetical protein C8J57DRAFT_446882 [Mycena rebaudengoi]|nr:hypothetical protein C8J57DRAFT_446882 [Mycena rebaudengoi]